MKFYLYDLETFFNCFLFCGKYEDDPNIQLFEISPRMNQRAELINWLQYMKQVGTIMVGYNSLSFDYPVLHSLLNNPYTFDHQTAYLEAQKIISQGYGNNFSQVRYTERFMPQLDLMKINHFDNPNRRTSLKSLQFAMRSASVEDLPYPFDKDLNSEQMDRLRAYNVHDVTETELFLKRCKPMIRMRQELLENGVLTGDVLNYSDVKIGAEYLVKKIGRQKCYNGRDPRQTFRSEIRFADVILPKISFKTEEFDAVLNWFRSQRVLIGHPDKPSLETTLAGIPFKFGLGGVHASVENRAFRSSATHIIKDIDVSGMYVAVAIANGFAPEHLGRDYSVAYRQLQLDRAQHKKGTTMNALLKLAGNGVYGNSNNRFSCFYDPKYTFTVTVNGQLQLIQLAEVLSLIPGLELIQANTDGITAYVPREHLHLFELWKSDWEKHTGLKLEEVDYSHMWIRDVNNYVARTMDGKMKRKGAYWYPTCVQDYEGVYNKDFSMMVVQKAASECLMHGYDPKDVVHLFTDPFDFMCRYKTTAGSTVYIGDEEMQKTVRYYVSRAGRPMKKIAKPKGEIGAWKRRNGIKDSVYEQVLREIPAGAWDERIHTRNKSKYQNVVTSIESGRLVKQCNRATDFNWSDVDYDYYATEIEKLVVFK